MSWLVVSRSRIFRRFFLSVLALVAGGSALASNEIETRCFTLLGTVVPPVAHPKLVRLARQIEADLAALETKFGPGYGGRTPEERRLVDVGTRLRDARRIAQSHYELDEFLTDEVLRGDAQSGQAQLHGDLAKLVPDLRRALLRYLDPPPPNDTFLVEISGHQKFREGIAAADELTGVYTRLQGKPGISGVEILADGADGSAVVLRVRGSAAWDLLRPEPGKHRFEVRGERNDRPRTLELTVSVLAEPTAKEVPILDKDLTWDTFTAGGPGGQHQNKTQSAVRVTHKPTGISVESRSERSQLRNKEDALARLRAEIARREAEAAATSATTAKRAQVGTSGVRSLPRVRSYDLYSRLAAKDDRTGVDVRLNDGTLRNLDLTTLQPAMEAARLQELLDRWSETNP